MTPTPIIAPLVLAAATNPPLVTSREKTWRLNGLTRRERYPEVFYFILRSELGFTILLGEVDDLLSDITEEEKNMSGSGRTRGIQNDVWKQDKELDQSFRDSGLAEAEQDVEIGRAVGN